MAELDGGPCEPWPVICDDFPDEPTPEEEALIEDATMAATEALWHRTKRRFGLCEVTLRPCRQECWPSAWWSFQSAYWQSATSWSWPFPALHGGVWINLGCGSCSRGSCSCSFVSETRLPYPVAEIIEVKIDGEVLSPDAYRVDNHNLLVRTDGLDWPRCNDLEHGDDAPGTWSVRATYGEVVPRLGRLAAGQLASEIYKSCVGKGSCLPGATVRQVTRQGVTKVFFDADSAFKNNKIGLYYTDLFIQTYNPSGTGTASIYNIDGPQRRYAGTGTS